MENYILAGGGHVALPHQNTLNSETDFSTEGSWVETGGKHITYTGQSQTTMNTTMNKGEGEK